MQSRLVALLVLLAALTATAADLAGYAKRIAPLIDPAKLATLGERAANPRVQKYVAVLAEAKAARLEPSTVAAQAVQLVKGSVLTIDN